MKRTASLLLASMLLLSACFHSAPPRQAAPTARSAMLLRLAHNSENAGNLASAASFYHEATEKSPSAQTFLERGRFDFRQGHYTQAIEAFRHGLDYGADDAELLRWLANAQIRADQPEDALATLKRVPPAQEDTPLVHNTRGVALDRLGHYADARAEYERALRLDPASRMTYVANLGMSWILSGDEDRAIATLKPLADAKNASPNIRQNLALAYGLKGDEADAATYAGKDMGDADLKDNERFYEMLSKRAPSPDLSAPATPMPPPAYQPPPIRTTPYDEPATLPMPVLKPDDLR